VSDDTEDCHRPLSPLPIATRPANLARTVEALPVEADAVKLTGPVRRGKGLLISEASHRSGLPAVAPPLPTDDRRTAIAYSKAVMTHFLGNTNPGVQIQ
jgi:hypothetical protein